MLLIFMEQYNLFWNKQKTSFKKNNSLKCSKAIASPEFRIILTPLFCGPPSINHLSGLSCEEMCRVSGWVPRKQRERQRNYGKLFEKKNCLGKYRTRILWAIRISCHFCKHNHCKMFTIVFVELSVVHQISEHKICI